MCGVVGLIGTAEAAKEAFLGLTMLQHRGQDAAGILTYDGDGFHRIKNIGLVESVFNRENMLSLTGNMAVGHTRYGTTGRGDMIEVQPFLLSYPFGMGIVHNGNIVNCREVADYLKKKARRSLLTRSDTEVIINVFAEGLARTPACSPDGELSFDHICEAARGVMSLLVGSYSIVIPIADKGLVAMRDPGGIRPLVWGRRKAKRSEDAAGILESGEAHIIASESAPLGFLGYELERDLKPGEVLYIDPKGNVHTRVVDGREARPCMFEWVYFSSPESVLDGVPVYGARIALGHGLAGEVRRRIEKGDIKADIIVPIPESSRIAAIALAEDLGIPYRELLIKNRYIKRTFILDSQEKRQRAVNLKLSPVRSEIAGKSVLLVDDSIVRGTTSRKIVELLRQAGALKVYIVSTCPPVKHPCFYGIDFPCAGELVASSRDLAAIERELGVDAAVYQTLEGLRHAVSAGQSGFRPCMACLDGAYPTDVTAAQGFSCARTKDRQGGNP
ncbi:MAG: amidophosphoribosyltransferase [Bdellovibrionales bacterium RIFOXYD1_FULL_53_11]|nr:MAG: amidophosphoribosyltransferase [Bdellovibrionales bacterium RIFOXYD1_FULL_53_11]